MFNWIQGSTMFYFIIWFQETKNEMYTMKYVRYISIYCDSSIVISFFCPPLPCNLNCDFMHTAIQISQGT